MQFTPQQLAGGQKFSSSCRIGNWQEEIALEESKLSNFEKKAASGSLALRKQQIKVMRSTEPVPHTYSDDGLIRFGDAVMLRHNLTNAILTCDVFERVEPLLEQYLVSGSMGSTAPVARNVFRIVRPPVHLRGVEDDDHDPVLRIGQAFCLACNESLLVNPESNVLAPTLYLCSIKKNERTATRRSNRQMVYMSPKNDADSVWVTALPSRGHKNASARYLSIGRPASIEDSIQITHRQTNMYLTTDPANKEMSEFGLEVEVFADRTAATGKLSLMAYEFKGLSTAQTLEKPDSPSYAWHFVVSSDPSTAVDDRQLPPPATTDVLLEQMREFIRSRGSDGFWEMREYFENLSKQLRSKVGKFEREDFKEAVLEGGYCPFEARYLDSIVDLVDTRRLRLIDYHEFVNMIRGETPDVRLAAIEDVFARLDASNQSSSNPPGTVSIDDLKRAFNGAEHPLAVQRNYSPAQALDHFLTALESGGRKPSAIGFNTFCQYFADLSACIDDDAYFAATMRNLWNV